VKGALSNLSVTFKIAAMALLGAVPGPSGQANAQTIGSSYTSIAPKGCRMIGKPSDLDGSTTRICPGKAGLVVLISPR
jgi:hypothetical protein